MFLCLCCRRARRRRRHTLRPFPPPTQQNKTQKTRFIQADLEAVDRAATPWVVVNVHRPFYVDSPVTDGGGDIPVAADLTRHLEPLLARHQVDMVWAGHVHLYQRSCPVLKGRCVGYTTPGAGGVRVANGPVHLTVGQGGYQSALVALRERPKWVEAQSWDYGFQVVEATLTKLTVTVRVVGCFVCFV